MSQYLSAMFRRRPNDGWFRVARYDVTTVDIITALAIASMFLYAASPSLFGKLTFVAPLVRNGEIWRIVTWPIAEQPNIFALLSIAFFWSFGQSLEALFGRGKFLAWVLAVTILPALALTLLGLVTANFDFTSFTFGIGLLFLAGIWVYAATYPNVRMFEVVPIWALAAGFTVLQLLQFSGARASGAILFLLISVAAALSIGRSLGVGTVWPIPHVPLDARSSGGGLPKRSRSSRKSKPTKPKRSKGAGSGQSVVEGPWRSNARPTFPTPPSAGAFAADQAELDGLLDKIGGAGMESLSADEKARLNELSKRLRGR